MDALFWITYSALEGVMNAGVFAHGNTNHPYNVHTFLNLPRGLVVVLCAALAISSGMEWYHGLVRIAAFMMIFPFFHDGFYHSARGMMDVPGDNFTTYRDESAWLDFPFDIRLILLIIGVIIYFATTII